MISSDVATNVKRTFGDEAGVQITDADIIRWINEAQEHIALKNEGLMETTSTTDIVAGTSVYPLPADFNVLRSLAYNGTHLRVLSFNEFNEYMSGFNAPANINSYGQGIPTVYMVWQNQITLFPTPSDSVTGGLYIYYIRHPTPVATLADPLSVPLEYHNIVVNYCLKQAYELDENLWFVNAKQSEIDQQLQQLTDRNKWSAQEYYPSVTVLPQDAPYGGGYYGFGGY